MSPSLGELLRERRIASGLSLEALSAISGISDRTISNLERGVSAVPQRRTLIDLLKALDVTGEEEQDLLRLARAPRQPVKGTGASAILAPHLIADFTGRVDILEEVQRRLHTGEPDTALSVLVISGAPGVGKTTLALEAMRRVDSSAIRCLFVDLHGLDPVPLSPLRILQALISQLPDTTAADTLDAAIGQWQRVTSDQAICVVLDNAAGEAQVRPVLAASAGTAVLITSRRSLSGIADARRVALGSLDRTDSVHLLGRIIPAQQRTEESLERLAELCDDLPLALRIAGNRIAARPRWSADDFAVKMSGRQNPLSTLVAGDLAVHTALALSYDQLDTRSRRLFRHLALIEGGTFDAQLAAATDGADTDDTEDRLDELCDLGLLEARGANRYRLHDLVRFFADTNLRLTEPDATKPAERLRRWILHTTQNAGSWFEPDPADVASPGMTFRSADDARAWLLVEAPHWLAAVRAAASAGEHATVLATADALHWFSDTWPAWEYWYRLFSLSAQAAIDAGDPRNEAVHNGYLAWVQIRTHDFTAGVVTANAALAAADRADDDSQRGWSLYYVAWALTASGQFDDAAESAAEALGRFTIAGDEEGVTQILALTAHVLSQTGRLEESVQHYRRILDQLDVRGPSLPRNIAMVTSTSAKTLMAEALTKAGNPRYALDTMPGVIIEATEHAHIGGQAAGHLELARAAAAIDDEALRAHHLQRARHLADEHQLRHVLLEVSGMEA
ncbi:hypothetical protein GCM10009775_22240 [Microbacterium aoyamense]|uniref:HTH cro/C1-type domain-containing protein n=1 Tax=Microbacterium aoyamense TaxID=344166 RepID=A0ABN2PUM9_9MICO|nr:helix-turn-helix domain-containing protein [Microbacterium aoyamense]